MSAVEEEEVVDWGDDYRQNEEDDEDVVALDEGSGEEHQNQDAPAYDAAEIHPSSLGTSPRRSRAPSATNVEVSGEFDDSHGQLSPKRVDAESSLASIASHTSIGSSGPPLTTITISHPSLPAKPSQEITLAAEAASREARKREREAQRNNHNTPASSQSAASNPWVKIESRSQRGEYYFRNKLTGETSWSKPPEMDSGLPARPRSPSPHSQRRSGDDRDNARESRHRDTSNRYDDNKRRDGATDRTGRERRNDNNNRTRPRGRSASPITGADSYAPSASNNWDSWVSNDDNDQGMRSDNFRANQGSADTNSAIPHRPQPPSRHTSSRDQPSNGREFNKQRYPAKGRDSDPNHWSPPRDNSGPTRPSQWRDEDYRSSGRQGERDYLSAQDARSQNDRRSNRPRSSSRSPRRNADEPRYRSPQTRRSVSPPYSGRSGPPHDPSPSNDEQQSRSFSSYNADRRHGRDQTEGNDHRPQRQIDRGPDNGWGKRNNQPADRSFTQDPVEDQPTWHKRAPLPPQGETFMQRRDGPPQGFSSDGHRRHPQHSQGDFGGSSVPHDVPSGPRADRAGYGRDPQDAPGYVPPSERYGPALSGKQKSGGHQSSGRRGPPQGYAEQPSIIVQRAEISDVDQDRYYDADRQQKRAKRQQSPSPHPHQSAKRSRFDDKQDGFARGRTSNGPNDVSMEGNTRNFGNRVPSGDFNPPPQTMGSIDGRSPVVMENEYPPEHYRRPESPQDHVGARRSLQQRMSIDAAPDHNLDRPNTPPLPSPSLPYQQQPDNDTRPNMYPNRRRGRSDATMPHDAQFHAHSPSQPPQSYNDRPTSPQNSTLAPPSRGVDPERALSETGSSATSVNAHPERMKQFGLQDRVSTAYPNQRGGMGRGRGAGRGGGNRGSDNGWGARAGRGGGGMNEGAFGPGDAPVQNVPMRKWGGAGNQNQGHDQGGGGGRGQRPVSPHMQRQHQQRENGHGQEREYQHHEERADAPLPVRNNYESSQETEAAYEEPPRHVQDRAPEVRDNSHSYDRNQNRPRMSGEGRRSYQRERDTEQPREYPPQESSSQMERAAHNGSREHNPQQDGDRRWKRNHEQDREQQERHERDVQTAGSLLQRMELPRSYSEHNAGAPRGGGNGSLRDRISRSPDVRTEHAKQWRDRDIVPAGPAEANDEAGHAEVGAGGGGNISFEGDDAAAVAVEGGDDGRPARGGGPGGRQHRGRGRGGRGGPGGARGGPDGRGRGRGGGRGRGRGGFQQQQQQQRD